MKLLQSAPIVLQAFGTLLVWLDTVRISVRPSSREYGLGDPQGDVGKYKRWYYRQGLPGFTLLLIGILLQGVLNWCAI